MSAQLSVGSKLEDVYDVSFGFNWAPLYCVVRKNPNLCQFGNQKIY